MKKTETITHMAAVHGQLSRSTLDTRRTCDLFPVDTGSYEMLRTLP